MFLQTLDEFAHATFYGISLGHFASAFGLFLLALILKRFLAHLFRKVIFPFAQKTETRYDDLFLAGLQKPLELLVVILGLFLAVQVLQLPSEPVNLEHFAYALLKILITFAVAWALYNSVGLVDVYLEQWVSRTESELDDHLLPFVRKCLRVFIIFLACIMLIQNLGYSISGLLASLGIGGLAVALAAKDTLSNVFGSLMIIADRPFRLGEIIRSGEIEGTVEEIGFRSTKIRTFDKSLISVPNSVITNIAVNNLSRMTLRRIRFSLGLTYASTPEQLRAVVARIRALLDEHPGVDSEAGILVHFSEFGASSLDILIQCFTHATSLAEHLPVKEELNLRIMEIVAELGLEVAFPSRTVYLRSEGEEAVPAAAEPGHPRQRRES